MNTSIKGFEIKKEVDLISLGFTFFVSYFFVIGFSLLPTLKQFELGLAILSFWSVGFLIFENWEIFQSISNTSRYLFYVFIGATLTFPLLLLKNTGLNIELISPIGVVLFIYIVYKHNLSFTRPNYQQLLLYITVTLSLFYGNNYIESISNAPIQLDASFIDNYYYTSVVASIRDGNIYNSLFEVGTPQNYHIGGFLGAATLADFAGIGSHTATWSIWVPLLRILSLLLFADVVVNIFKKFSPNGTITWVPLLSVVLLFLTGPINPSYLVKWDPSKLLWIGTPYTIPDMPALASGYIVMLLLINFVIIDASLFNWKNRFLFIFLMALLVICKVTVFFSLFVFLFIIALNSIVRDRDYNTMKTILLGLIPTIVTYKLFFTSTSVNKIVFSFGYLPTFYANAAGFEKHPILIGSIIAFVIVLLIWTGIKLIGLVLLLKEREWRVLCIASILSLIASMLLGFVFKIQNIDDLGVYYMDLSYDLPQFIKSSLTIFTLFGIAGLLIFLSSSSKKGLRRFLSIVVLIWGFLISISIIAKNNMDKSKLSIYENNWVDEVIKEIKTEEPGLMAMSSTNLHSGQLLCAHDIGPWWSCFSHADGGVAHSYINFWRQREIKKLLSINELDTAEIKKITEILNKENVKYLIAIPENRDEFERLDSLNIIDRIENKKWVYKIP